MYILYGSQNFGYDKPDSDVDLMRLIIPSWDDIVHNRCTSTTVNNSDGGITKITDIRKYSSMLKSGDFSIIQTLYSKQYVYENDNTAIHWFICHKEEIVRADLYRLYISNKNHILRDLDVKRGFLNINSKVVTRANTFAQLLERLLDSSPFKLCDKSRLQYRLNAEAQNVEWLKSEADRIIEYVTNLESEYERYKDNVNESLFKDMDVHVANTIKLLAK